MNGSELMTEYKSRSAREAKESNYGGESYWDYLEGHALELDMLFPGKGFLDRSLSEALSGNEGE